MTPSTLLIPVRKTKLANGTFRFENGATLASPRSADAVPLEQLRDKLKSAGLKKLHITFDAATPAAVRIYRSASIPHAEGYRLTVAESGIDITVRTDAGAYYAVQTLIDLLSLHGTTLPACRMDDEPDFKRRGIYYDCARGKVPTLDTLKNLVIRLAHWKINELQLYIENGFTFQKHPSISKGFSPFTPADILELQAFCKQHHIRFVGSLTSFGHMELILQNPAYTHLGELPGFGGNAGGSTLCPADPGSIRLVRDLYSEYLPLFESDDFNACGDEPWELGKGRSRKKAEATGSGRLYLDFMLKVHRLCTTLGKRTNVWADIALQHPELLKQWPKEIVMLNWAYDAANAKIEKSKLIADAGLPFMVCSGTNGWGTHGSRLRAAIANVDVFVKNARQYGAEGLLHTDWGDRGHRNTLAVSLCSFAHAAAHAWNGRAVQNETFPATFCRFAFGQTDNRFADQLEVIGSITTLVGSHAGLYYSLRQGLFEDPSSRSLRVTRYLPDEKLFAAMDRVKLQDAAERLAPLCNLSAWPELPAAADRFDRLSRESFALAAKQDYAACKRMLIAHRLKDGQLVTAGEWKQMDGLLGDLGKQFDTLWLAQNRPSRLKENQFLLNHARLECRHSKIGC